MLSITTKLNVDICKIFLLISYTHSSLFQLSILELVVGGVRYNPSDISAWIALITIATIGANMKNKAPDKKVL